MASGDPGLDNELCMDLFLDVFVLLDVRYIWLVERRLEARKNSFV